MAGFLDPKQRVMDVILTEIGRQQMVKGDFDVKFVSFSDKGVDYQDQGDGVLEPITERLFFEAFSQASDEIIPEIDSLGKFIIDQEVPGTLEVRDGVLYELTGSGGYVEVDGYSRVSTFTENTKQRFDNLQVLNTISAVQDFSVSPFTFGALSGSVTSDDGDIDNIDGLIPLSIDPRFENQINMRYLPPKIETNGSLNDLKSFNKWTDTDGSSENYPDESTLQKKLTEISGSMKGSKTTFTIGNQNTEDYEEYNILGQVFVKKQQTLKKYVIIDAGEFFDEENIPVARIYYLGFVYKDGLGITKFVREFSMVFHKGDIS